jgi:hypothetical protein
MRPILLLSAALLLPALLLAPAESRAQAGAGGVAATPSAAQARAVTACEDHLRRQYEGLTTIFSSGRAGAEQDGLVLVTGQLSWREASARPHDFACIVPRGGGAVAAAMAPPRPQGVAPQVVDRPGAARSPEIPTTRAPGAAAGRTPSVPGAGGPASAHLGPAQIAACQDAIVRSVEERTQVRPIFTARATGESAGEGPLVRISGGGTIPQRPSSVNFTYRCSVNASTGAVVESSWEPGR